MANVVCGGGGGGGGGRAMAGDGVDWMLTPKLRKLMDRLCSFNYKYNLSVVRLIRLSIYYPHTS